MPIVLKSKKEMFNTLQSEIDKATSILVSAERAHPDLNELFSVYQKAIKLGVDMPFVDCRIKDLSQASPDDIYLGDINGIWTNPIPAFEDLRYSDSETYRTIVEQFRKQIARSAKYYRASIMDSGISRTKLSHNIVDAINKFVENHNMNGKCIVPVKCKILDGMINKNSIVHFELEDKNGRTIVTSGVIVYDSYCYLPENFWEGKILKSKDIGKTKFASLDSLASNHNKLYNFFETAPFSRYFDISDFQDNKIASTPLDSNRSEIKDRYLNLQKRKGMSL